MKPGMKSFLSLCAWQRIQKSEKRSKKNAELALLFFNRPKCDAANPVASSLCEKILCACLRLKLNQRQEKNVSVVQGRLSYLLLYRCIPCSKRMQIKTSLQFNQPLLGVERQYYLAFIFQFTFKTVLPIFATESGYLRQCQV